MDGVDGVRAGVTASVLWATGSGYRFTRKGKTITEPHPLQTLCNCGHMHMLMQ